MGLELEFDRFADGPANARGPVNFSTVEMVSSLCFFDVHFLSDEFTAARSSSEYVKDAVFVEEEHSLSVGKTIIDPVNRAIPLFYVPNVGGKTVYPKRPSSYSGRSSNAANQCAQKVPAIHAAYFTPELRRTCNA